MKQIVLFLGEIVNNGLLQQKLTLSADIGKQCFNISFGNDELAEEDKSFRVTLENIKSTLFPYSPYQIHTQEAIITIFDDDGRTLIIIITVWFLEYVPYSACILIFTGQIFHE